MPRDKRKGVFEINIHNGRSPLEKGRIEKVSVESRRAQAQLLKFAGSVSRRKRNADETYMRVWANGKAARQGTGER